MRLRLHRRTSWNFVDLLTDWASGTRFPGMICFPFNELQVALVLYYVRNFAPCLASEYTFASLFLLSFVELLYFTCSIILENRLVECDTHGKGKETKREGAAISFQTFQTSRFTIGPLTHAIMAIISSED